MNLLTADEVTADWLAEQLRRAGHEHANLLSFVAQDIGTGQSGRCIRYQLNLAPGSGDAPSTLVAKTASANPTSKDTGEMMKIYRTEVAFYRHIAPTVSMRVPTCYYTAIDDRDREHFILLEDMAPAIQGDQIEGCTPMVAHEAVVQLAGLAGPSWRDDSWDAVLGRVQDGPFAGIQALYKRTMPGFVEFYGTQMDPAHIRFIQAIGAAQTCPLFEFHGENFGLEHYDYRLDNLLIGGTADQPSITTVDWQSVRVGKPLQDVAFFIGSSLTPDVRRQVELDILRDYHRALVNNGAAGYAWETCLQDYRRGIYAGFGISVMSPVLVVRTERGDRMFMTMASRYAEMAMDWEIEEFMH